MLLKGGKGMEGGVKGKERNEETRRAQPYAVESIVFCFFSHEIT